MEELNLTETEQRYFGDLFLCCDEESSGKIPILKATELFRSSNISNEVLKQISDLSFPQNKSTTLTHINRKQFYSALKLIAAYQANMALKSDLLTTSVELPLPRFNWNYNCETASDLIQLSTSPTIVAPKEQHFHKRDKSFGLYEKITVSSNSSDVDIPQVVSQHDHSEAQSTDSEVESETISQRSERSHTMRGKDGSPWSTGSESPTPTNSVAERGAAVSSQDPQGARWPQPHVGEENTHLLGTEEESSDRHSSDEDGADKEVETPISSVWRIASDQRRHYASQFHQLHPDSRGRLPGNVARTFFAKSRLSAADLHKIWILCDITKDGALCIEEFTTAMHLIVLRRNEIPVPDVLPSCLIPKSKKFSIGTPEQVITSNLVDLGSDSNINLVGEVNSNTSNMTSSLIKITKESENLDGQVLKNFEDSSPSLSPLSVDSSRVKPEPITNNKEWTKFIDSPTSSISSPGPKPVNFDFPKASLDKDPKIFHPVPLRVTPESSTLPLQTNDSGGTSPRKVDDLNYYDVQDVASPKKLSGQHSIDNQIPAAQSNVSEIKPIQRPQAKKVALKSIGAIPPPPTKDWNSGSSEDTSGPMSLQYAPAPKKDPPPPPPPRPLRTHTRSSSLDLNKLKGTHVSNMSQPTPPQVPPRISPSLTSPLKKLTNQRSESDMFDQDDAFAQTITIYQTKFTDEPQPETFANFAQFQNNLPLPGNENSIINLPKSRASFEDETQTSNIPRKHGAFEIYRKPTPRSSVSPDTASIVDSAVNPLISVREDSLKKLQEQNSLLCRLCRELSLELAVVQRERQILRLKLESNVSGI